MNIAAGGVNFMCVPSINRAAPASGGLCTKVASRHSVRSSSYGSFTSSARNSVTIAPVTSTTCLAKVDSPTANFSDPANAFPLPPGNQSAHNNFVCGKCSANNNSLSAGNANTHYLTYQNHCYTAVATVPQGANVAWQTTDG